MPTYAMDLMLKLLDDTTSVQDVVEAIKRDPSIAALVLRVVNSAQYAFSKKIETFYHACIILGFNNLYSLIMREAMESTLPQNEQSEKIHSHSCLISFIAYELCSYVKDIPSQSIITLGLLHDIGRGVQVVMKQSNWTIPEYVDTFDTARLGADLLRKWELPDRLCRIVEVQEQAEFTPPDLIAPEFRREIGILHIAHVLESLIIRDTPAATIYTKDYMAAIGITGTTPEALLKERIIPVLTRNLRRLPHGVQTMSSPPSKRKAFASLLRYCFLPMRLRAFAKINLDLRILGKRPDGFQELRTVFQAIDWSDDIDIELSDRFSFFATVGPQDEANLVVRAVRCFERAAQRTAQVAIRLTKNVPSGAGLGGGSSDAAVTFLGLQQLYNRPVATDAVNALKGSTSRSSCLEAGRWAPAVASGREPLEDEIAYWLVLVEPGFSISTASAYSWLTLEDKSNKIEGFCAQSVLPSMPAGTANDFEGPCSRGSPQLGDRDELVRRGRSGPALSGVGRPFSVNSTRRVLPGKRSRS